MGEPTKKLQAVSSAPAAKQAAPQASAHPTQRIVKKGELLFSEGDTSRAMYLVRSGVIRIFKKKGDTPIEIDTIHSGQIVGELAFLDGNPRSASAEALSECELTEISGPSFQAVLERMPDWLKIMLRTIVGRLRTASTKIRQLETASIAIQYDEQSGKRNQNYVFISPYDAMKISTAILLVGIRNGESKDLGIEVKSALLQRYANQVMGVPMAKITAYIDVLHNVGVVTTDVKEYKNISCFLRDPNTLEKFIGYLNEENFLEAAKKHDITPRGFLIMRLIMKYLGDVQADAETGIAKLNIAEIHSKEMAAQGGKEIFRMDQFPELVKVGYATNLAVNSATEILTDIKVESFKNHFRMQRLVMELHALNEQKRKAA